MSAFFEAWAWAAVITTAVLLAVIASYALMADSPKVWHQALALAYLVAAVSAFAAAIVVLEYHS